MKMLILLLLRHWPAAVVLALENIIKVRHNSDLINICHLSESDVGLLHERLV